MNSQEFTPEDGVRKDSGNRKPLEGIILSGDLHHTKMFEIVWVCPVSMAIDSHVQLHHNLQKILWLRLVWAKL